MKDLTVGSTGFINAATGDKYETYANFFNNSTDTANWNTAGALLSFLGTGDEHFAPGNNAAFKWAALTIGSDVQLYIDSGALYIDSLYGVDLDSEGHAINILGGIAGLEVYYSHLFNATGQEIFGDGSLELRTGSATPTPEPAVFYLLVISLIGLTGLQERRKIS